MKAWVEKFKNLIGLHDEMIEEQDDMQENVPQQQTISSPVQEMVHQPLPQPVQQAIQPQPVQQPLVQQPIYNQNMVQPQPQLSMPTDFEDMLFDEQNKRKRVNRQNGNIIDISTAPSNEMVIIEPKNLDDASRVVSLLRSKKAVIVSYMNTSLSQELRDAISNFICGAICALDGNQEIITQQGVFLFTPGNISINNLNEQTTLQRVVDKSANNLFFTINDMSNSKKKEKESKAS
ncbi:MAG: cell division protein SepF [Candidatus Sericytochromatia bacterium]